MNAGVGARSSKGAPAPLRSISYSVRFQTGVSPPEPSCACMVAGEPHRPACQPTTGNLFMFHCCQVPVRRRPKEELQTTQYCELLPLARSEWGFLRTVSGEGFWAIQGGPFINFRTHAATSQHSLNSPKWTELHIIKRVLRGSFIEIPNRLT